MAGDICFHCLAVSLIHYTATWADMAIGGRKGACTFLCQVLLLFTVEVTSDRICCCRMQATATVAYFILSFPTGICYLVTKLESRFLQSEYVFWSPDPVCVCILFITTLQGSH